MGQTRIFLHKCELPQLQQCSANSISNAPQGLAQASLCQKHFLMVTGERLLKLLFTTQAATVNVVAAPEATMCPLHIFMCIDVHP